MKKTVLAVFSILLSISSVFAQESSKNIRVSLTLSPNLSLTRLTTNTTNLASSYSNVTNNGVAVRYKAGIILDFGKGNAVFSTGITYNVRAVNTKWELSNTAYKDVPSGTYNYNLQYLQIPLTAKLYTNEIADDMKLYFQLGPTLDFKIAEKLNKGASTQSQPFETQVAKGFFFFDASLLAGAGLEWQLGDATAAFFGLSYNRGLFNTINYRAKYNTNAQSSVDVNDAITAKTAYVSLDLGIKF
ncbi:MAG: hypothetical protein RLZZ175_1488 [Bacteroidota bacterium]|jgi:hypothetical protein